MIWLLDHTHLQPASCLSFSVFLACRWSSLLSGEGRGCGGGAKSLESLVLYKSFNTRWSYIYKDICVCLCRNWPAIYPKPIYVIPVFIIHPPTHELTVSWLRWSYFSCTAKKFEFMYSQKRNCAASVPMSTFKGLWASYLYVYYSSHVDPPYFPAAE